MRDKENTAQGDGFHRRQAVMVLSAFCQLTASNYAQDLPLILFITTTEYSHFLGGMWSREGQGLHRRSPEIQKCFIPPCQWRSLLRLALPPHFIQSNNVNFIQSKNVKWNIFGVWRSKKNFRKTNSIFQDGHSQLRTKVIRMLGDLWMDLWHIFLPHAL